MSEGKERANARLENLQAIEPLLSSLRVLSLSTMQMAMNRQHMLDQYASRFNEIAKEVMRRVDQSKLVREIEAPDDYRPPVQEQILAVIGSTRGIVGQYNKNLARIARATLEKNEGDPMRVVAFGSRVHSAMRQEGLSFREMESLSAGSLPDYDSAAGMIREWTEGFEEKRISRVQILSFKRVGTGTRYKPTLTELLPGKMDSINYSEEEELAFPPPIIEGDPVQIFEEIQGHFTALSFYRLILDAIAAENLFRFRLLEEARENTSNLLEELSLEVQSNRRKEITQQLQELLVGSGMLASR